MTIWAGRAMMIIAAAHTVLFSFNPYWSQWLSGDLWGGAGSGESLTVFWALPGGFVATLVLLGLLVSWFAKLGHRMPSYLGWVLLGWALFCAAIIGPSGFLTALVPAGLLIAADLKHRRTN
jgi:hypothetical protein